MAKQSHADLLRQAQRTARQLVVDHVPWLVYELPPTPFDRRSKSSLIFESEGIMRRVRGFPADWRALTDDELYALSWGA
jgi:hypothetical protein